MIFKKKNEQIKKMMNGELERLKNGMLKHIDTIKEVINLYMDNLDKKTTLMVNQKVERVNLSLKSLKPHRLG